MTKILLKHECGKNLKLDITYNKLNLLERMMNNRWYIEVTEL